MVERMEDAPTLAEVRAYLEAEGWTNTGRCERCWDASGYRIDRWTRGDDELDLDHHKRWPGQSEAGDGLRILAARTGHTLSQLVDAIRAHSVILPTIPAARG